jgi:hypothetical protein
MAILEINLDRPALIEEYRFPDEMDGSTGRAGSKSAKRTGSKSKSSGGMKGKLVGLLVVVAAVGVAVWKLKSSSGSKQTDFDEFDEEGDHEEGEYEHGPDPDIGADKKYEVKRKAKGKVTGLLGLAVALVTVVSVVRKARN